MRWLALPLLLFSLGLGASNAASASGPAISAAPAPLVPTRTERVSVPEGYITVRGALVDLHGDPSKRAVLDALAAHADGRAPLLADQLGLPLGERIDVFLAADDAEFREIQPGNPPGWADATAYPSLSAVFLRSPANRGTDPEPLEMVLDHELVHVVVGRAFAPHRPPTWLQEGLAQLVAGQHSPDSVRKLAAGAVSGPIPLEELEARFPADPHRAGLAYAQSVDFLVYLQREHGPLAVPALVRHLRDGKPLSQAIFLATGLPLDQVDAAWRSQLRVTSQAQWLQVIAGEGPWFAAALLGTVAMFHARRRQRQRRDEIAAAEAREEALLRAVRPQPRPPERFDRAWLVAGQDVRG
jgi:hypothetical protein